MEYKVRYFDYPAQFRNFREKYLEIFDNTLSAGKMILQEDVECFESNLAKFVDSKYAIGVGSGTGALLLSLMACGIGLGDEVITVSHTFVATVEVIKLLGAIPVLVDIDDSHNMDIDLVEEVITERTKAIIPVHLNGRICNKMEKLQEIAYKYNLMIIEDAAQALGASYKGKKAGTFGITGCFSFYPAKILGAFGDAGAIVTNDENIARKLKALRNHGREGAEIICWGFNCRLDNIQAAILNYKLELIPQWIKRRREIAKIYQEELSEISELRLPPAPTNGGDHYDVFQNYEIEAERRDELIQYLKSKGIEVMLPWGGKAVHQFKALGLDHYKLPRTEKFFEKAIMLPMYPELKDEEVKYITQTIKDFYARNKN